MQASSGHAACNLAAPAPSLTRRRTMEALGGLALAIAANVAPAQAEDDSAPAAAAATAVDQVRAQQAALRSHLAIDYHE